MTRIVCDRCESTRATVYRYLDLHGVLLTCAHHKLEEACS